MKFITWFFQDWQKISALAALVMFMILSFFTGGGWIIPTVCVTGLALLGIFSYRNYKGKY